MLHNHVLIVAVAAFRASAQSFTHTFTGTRGAAIACTQVLHEELPKLTGAPEPDEEIYDIAVGFVRGALSNENDNCNLPDIQGRTAEQFSEWASSFTEWRDEQVTIYQEIYSACSDVPDAAHDIPTQSGVCSTLVAKITGGPVPPREGNDGEDEGGGDSEERGNSDDVDGDGEGDGDGNNDSSSPQLSGMGPGAAAVASVIIAFVLYHNV